tara:strand:- start:6185 stop:6721 length:537 start_codon:yes stop_codon:yes gene_type:complete
MDKILKYFIDKYKGNILEIGAGHGDTTIELTKLAKDRKVIVVDPFEDGWDEMPKSYGQPYPYKIFASKLQGHLKNGTVILHKCLSNDKHLKSKLKENLPISFCFLDGLQYEENVLEDLLLLESLNVNIIALDDFTRETETSQVPSAVTKFTRRKTYKLVGSINHPHGQGRIIGFLEKT